MTEKQQFNVYLPPALIRKVKHAAIEGDQSLSSFVEVLLNTHLARPSEAPANMTLMPIVYVRRMTDSIRFYQSLGLALRHEGPTWSELSLGDAVLALHRHDEKPSGPPPMGLAFVARTRLEALVERLRAAEFDQPLDILDEGYGRSITLRDPDGHSIKINEHDPDLHKS